MAWASGMPLPVQPGRVSFASSTSARPSPSGPEKLEPLLAEGLVARDVGHAGCGEPLLPPAERTRRDREDGGADFAGAGPAADDVGEREIGHHRAGRAGLVAVVEVIDAGFVEIDGLLDPAQAQRAGPELIVLGRTRGHRGHVVQTLDLLQHNDLLSLTEIWRVPAFRETCADVQVCCRFSNITDPWGERKHPARSRPGFAAVLPASG